MKIMKILGALILTIGLFQCKSIQFDKNPPFIINSATYNHYVGGIQGVSGSWVRVQYTAEKTIVFDSIYFQGKKAKIEIQKIKDKMQASAHFNTSKVNSREDLILHRDGKLETGNKLPEKKFPFELKENEAVISYKNGEKTSYFKVENLKQTKSPLYQ